MSELDDFNTAVRKLTAVTVIIFQVLEIVEDLYPTAAEYLKSSLDGYTDIVDHIVIDAFRQHETFLARPNMQFEEPATSPATFKDDLMALEGIVENLAVSEWHQGELGRANDHLDSAINMIALVDRSNLEPDGELVGPWEVLNPGES